jgi:phage recombination protein Bet
VTDLEVIRPELAERYPAPPPLSLAQIDAVRSLLAPDLTDAELDLFVAICNRSGLDPFGRQIWAYKRPNLVIQASIDGLRLIALRTGLYGGQHAAKWCGPDRQWVDVWLGPDPPAAAMKAVIRKDYPEPTVAVAVFDSYAARNAKGELQAVWRTAPDVMIAKCAEALAIRQAFPNETAGLYVAGEIPTDEPTPVAAAVSDPPVSGDERGFLRAAIENLSESATTWLTGVAKADKVPNLDGPRFRRSHRDRLAWHVVVAQRIKPEGPAEEADTPDAA